MKILKNIAIISLLVAIFGLIFISNYRQTAYESTYKILAQVYDVLDLTKNARVDTSGAGLVTKVAPGELLPILVKLSNFGGGGRVDVLIEYVIITNEGDQIYSTSETVAVETTANFIKTIQIPFETNPGKYIAKSSVVYQGQTIPATTEFPFSVERKIFGFFQSDFFLYGGIIILISFITGILGHFWVKHHRKLRLLPVDYSDIPSNQRIFFEIISDTIMGMRVQVGEKALDIARRIDGLVIDEKTYRVLKLTEKPSKVIAELVSEYEKSLGKKVSFSFRRS